MAEYDIFISYRRIGGSEMAEELYTQLSMRGYRVFLDREENWTGDYTERLPQYVRDCTDFILVLPKDALNRCANEDDMVRIEIATAIEHSKQIIPLYMHGFTMPAQLPECIATLPNYNGFPTYGMSFKKTLYAVIDRLLSQREQTEIPQTVRVIHWLRRHIYLWRIVFFPILAGLLFCLFAAILPYDYFRHSADELNFILCGLTYVCLVSTLTGILLWFLHKLNIKLPLLFFLSVLSQFGSYLALSPLINLLWNHQYNLWHLPLGYILYLVPIAVTLCALFCTFIVNLGLKFCDTLTEAVFR